MSWLFSKQEETIPSFGLKVNASKFKAVELKDMDDKFKVTSEKLGSEISKYKKVASLNKKLTESYLLNYKAMIDISKLLNDYAEIFNRLKEVLSKYNEIEISPVDLKHLEEITRAQMDKINTEFSQHSTKIKNLYSKYGLEDELGKLNTVDLQAREVGNLSDEALAQLRKTAPPQAVAQPVFGGNDIRKKKAKKANGNPSKKTGKKAKK